MRKVSARALEWCSVAVLLEGRSDAQVYFLRWLKRSEFAHLEVTGTALVALKRASIAKTRAPVGTLVLVADLLAIAAAYNARNPKHRVEDILEGLPWLDTVELDNLPGVTYVAGSSQIKRARVADDKDDNIEANDDDEQYWTDVLEHPEPLPGLGLLEDMPAPLWAPLFALAHTPTWIVVPGARSVVLQGAGQPMQQVLRSVDSAVLLPALPPGAITLLVDGEPRRVTVISAAVSKLVMEEVHQ